MTRHPFVLAAAIAAAAFLSPPAVHAAESFDGCTGFIDAVPAVVNKPGTWCLRAGLEYAPASGAAITVAGNHITIECNDYALKGLSPLTGSTAVGVFALNRANTTVRNCRIGGFSLGVSISGRGHEVHDNDIERINSIGINVQSNPGLVRDNRVTDVGTEGGKPTPRGIAANGDVDVLRNVVDRVQGQHATAPAVAIQSRAGVGNVIADNRVLRVRNVLAGGFYGIQAGAATPASRTVVRDNWVSALGSGQPGYGIFCGSATILVRDNQVSGWPTALAAACVASGNLATNVP